MPAFKSAGLPGKEIVWREILSEGPAVALLPAFEFWQKRQAYISDTYHENSEGYQQKVLQELPKLEAAGTFNEIVLWFDADLMCQVNLLYLLQHLYQLHPRQISLCTPAAGENIGLMAPRALQLLFEQRQQLTDIQLKHAQALWQLYAGPDPLKLQEYISEENTHLPVLRKALQLHLRRFPSCTTGLGSPEMDLLKLVQQGATTENELMQRFWKHYPEYGYGDSQLELMLRHLHPLFVLKEDHITLSEFGERVLKGEVSYITGSQWLGGVLITANGGYCFNAESHQLENC